MAQNKSSKFNADDQLFDNQQEVQHAQEVQQVQEPADVSFSPSRQGKELGKTQGRKGQKLKRINMAFSDVNHEYIKKESRKRGLSATEFVNMIIENYRK